MTLLGYITLVIAVTAVFVRWEWVIAFLAITMTWNNATIYEWGPNLLKPFYLVLGVFWFRVLFDSSSGGATSNRRGLNIAGFLFVCLYAIGCSIVCPSIFEGAETLLPREGVDDQVAAMSRLSLSITNYGQAVYWSIHAVFTGILILGRSGITQRDWIRGITIGGGVFIGISIIEVVTDFAGLYFPYELFNNAGLGFMGLQQWGGFNRLQSTFMEPSSVGAYMTPIFVFFMLRFQYERKAVHAILAICAAGVLARSLSSTALVGLVLAYIISLLSLISRSSLGGKKTGFIPYFLIAIVMGVLVYIAFDAGMVDGLLLNKMESSSGQNRTAADLIALSVFKESWGLGYGFGSFRSSSLAFTVLASGGAVVFSGLMYLVYRASCSFFRPKGDYSLWLMAGMLLSTLMIAFVSAPDANSAVLWLSLAAYLFALNTNLKNRVVPSRRLGFNKRTV